MNLDQFGELAAVATLALGAIDPDQKLAQKTRGVAADLVVAERKLVDPRQHHRQPLGGADYLE